VNVAQLENKQPQKYPAQKKEHYPKHILGKPIPFNHNNMSVLYKLKKKYQHDQKKMQKK